MTKFFDQENLLFRFMGILGDLIMLNLLVLLCGLPVVTIGASLTSMHYVLWHMVKGEKTYVCRQFLESFRNNCRQATLAWLLIMVSASIVAVDLIAFDHIFFDIHGFVKMAIGAVVALVSVVVNYFFILMSRYATSSLAGFCNACRVTIGFFPRTVAMVIILSAAFMIYIRFFLHIFPLLILMGLTLPQYCCAWVYSPIFKRLEDNER